MRTSISPARGGSTVISSMRIPSAGSWKTAARIAAEDRVTGCSDETVWQPRARRVRALERRPAGSPPRRRGRLRRAARRVHRRPRAASGTRSSATSEFRSPSRTTQVLDESGGARVAALVRRRPPQPRERVRRALRRRPCECGTRGRRLGGRGGRRRAAGRTPSSPTRRARLAEGLEALGVGEGDAVALLLPMVPEAVAALYAVASLGALAVPIFSGFSAPAVASRLVDSGATVLITCDAFPRRGRPSPSRRPPIALQPTPRRCGTSSSCAARRPRSRGRRAATSGTTISSPAARASAARRQVESEHPVLLGYTSGTTGRPKGAVHVHAGLLVKLASETAYIGDLGADDRVHWSTDLGWIMGPVAADRHARARAAPSRCSTAHPTSPTPDGSGSSSSAIG